MAMYRSNLPQLRNSRFLTDGGLETTLVFHHGLDLPCFAAFPLVTTEEGRNTLRTYFAPYLETARKRNMGFVLDTVTWRTTRDWGMKLGYSAEELADIERRSVAFACELREAYAAPNTPVVINGILGPRGDGYSVTSRMNADEAQDYHAAQMETFRDTDTDMVSAMTLTYPEEALGIVRAAQSCGLPVVISFTLETDGRLPSGDTLKDAIEAVDAATGSGPVYYMINCAHPTHFAGVVANSEAWLGRIGGLRANASTMSHAELDAATELDAGDPVDLGKRYKSLRRQLQHLCVMGGCCGTDHRHIAAICEACFPQEAPSNADRSRRIA